MEPFALISEDGGETWSEPIPVCDKRGMIRNAIVRDGVIYVMIGAWSPINKDELEYFLYKSEDSGRSYSLVSQIPAERKDGYGNIDFLEDGAMICYMYIPKDEHYIRYHISYDNGATWAKTGKSYVAKRIRNTEVAKVKGGYILHGRSGQEPDLPSDLVLYTSKDGLTWDEGVYLTNASSPRAYYTNELVMDQDDGSQRVLIQASIPYDGWAKVNIAHWFLEIE